MTGDQLWSRRAGTAAIAVMAVVLSFASSARAQRTAAFLPAPGGHADHPDAEQRARVTELHLRAVSALRDFLEPMGVEVIVPADVRTKVREGLRTCSKTTCAAEVAKAVGADYAIVLAIWLDGQAADGAAGGAAQATATITLVSPLGERFPGERVPIENGHIEKTALAAFSTAQARFKLGRGPWLHVTGEPRGAAVALDGTPVGALPYRTAIPPGEHTLTVTRTGYAPSEQTIHIPLHDTEELEIEVALEPGAGGTSVGGDGHAPPVGGISPEPVTRVSAWNYVLGGGLLAAAAPLVGIGAKQWAEDGDCIERDAGDRCRYESFGTGEKVMLGVGVATAAAGVALLIWRPIRTTRVDLNVDGRGATLRVEGRF